jgi:hypothetical protein
MVCRANTSVILEAVDLHAGWDIFRYKTRHLSIECRNHFSPTSPLPLNEMGRGAQQEATRVTSVVCESGPRSRDRTCGEHRRVRKRRDLRSTACLGGWNGARVHGSERNRTEQDVRPTKLVTDPISSTHKIHRWLALLRERNYYIALNQDGTYSVH